jgi:hypothetical protein
MQEPTVEDWGRLSDKDRQAIMDDPVTGSMVIGWQGNGLPVVHGNYADLCRALKERLGGKEEAPDPPKRGPGRPRKNPVDVDKPRRGPGRPRKNSIGG